MKLPLTADQLQAMGNYAHFYEHYGMEVADNARKTMPINSAGATPLDAWECHCCKARVYVANIDGQLFMSPLDRCAYREAHWAEELALAERQAATRRR